MTPTKTDATRRNDGEKGAHAAPRKRRTQAERVAESDRKMLAAALQLIGERGYRGTSLAAIGEASGYSRGLVHERFGSKEGLLWALVKRMLRVWNRESAQQGQAGHSGIAALEDVLDNHRRAVLEDRGIKAFYQLMFEALGPVPDLRAELQTLHQRFRADMERAMREGIASGELRADIDPAAQAVALMGSLRGIAFQWLLEPGGFDLDAVYAELKANLRRSLTREA